MTLKIIYWLKCVFNCFMYDSLCNWILSQLLYIQMFIWQTWYVLHWLESRSIKFFFKFYNLKMNLENIQSQNQLFIIIVISKNTWCHPNWIGFVRHRLVSWILNWVQKNIFQWKIFGNSLQFFANKSYQLFLE